MGSQQTLNTKKSSLLSFIVVGILLVCVISFVIYFVFAIINLFFSLLIDNEAFLTWNLTAIISFPFVLGFSYFYFSRRDILRKRLMVAHSLATAVFLIVVIGGRLAEFREQQEVLSRYQVLVQSIRKHDQDSVNKILLPTYRESFHEETNTWLFMSMSDAPHLSPYAVSIHLFENEAFVEPDARISRWYDPSCGYYVKMKKYQGEWYYGGGGGLLSC